MSNVVESHEHEVKRKKLGERVCFAICHLFTSGGWKTRSMVLEVRMWWRLEGREESVSKGMRRTGILAMLS